MQVDGCREQGVGLLVGVVAHHRLRGRLAEVDGPPRVPGGSGRGAPGVVRGAGETVGPGAAAVVPGHELGGPGMGFEAVRGPQLVLQGGPDQLVAERE
jgi:hypothetical protein